jgi:hypothetical protein
MDYRILMGRGHEAVSVTTQYSPDGGAIWYTDEAARDPNYDWDNIHGDIVCGPTKYNLQAGHLYKLRALLNYLDGGGGRHQVQSNMVEAKVEDYSELCLEEELAQKFRPVLHRHPQDLQPEGLVDLDKVRWASRTVTNSKGEIYSDGITKHSAFHWNRYYDWDTWGEGQKPARFRWDMDDAERYKEELPGEGPLYYHVYRAGQYYYVQYWYFMTMNDIRGQTENKTWHEGDFEHVTIEVEKVDETFIPRRINFYKHEGGRQFPAEECYWGAGSEGIEMKVPPKKGYDKNCPHLHVWIARNSHASYNLQEPIYQLIVHVEEPIGDNSLKSTVYTEDVAYDPEPQTQQYETFFKYDYLVNMGEIVQSRDTDGDGFPNAHGWEWFEHWEHKRAWHDLQWMPFKGRFGAYWCVNAGIDVACTESPGSPAHHEAWILFQDNIDCGGFGNRDTNQPLYSKEYRWLDPSTGVVVCRRPFPRSLSDEFRSMPGMSH